MAYQHKIHRFTDCKGFNTWTTPVERDAMTTLLLYNVTCGACKQRIVNALVKAEGRALKPETLATLNNEVLPMMFLQEHDEAARERG
jgi:hypothetical protein